MTPAKRRELLLNIGLAAGMFLGLCVAAEFALRYFLLSKYNPFEPDAALGARLKSDFEGAYPRVAVRTDRHGNRVPLDQDIAASGRYLFIGDSVTFGFSVAAEQAFPVLIGASLGAPADATIAAVPGYNLGQAIGLARESIERVRPELVIYTLVVNDLGSALSPTTYAGLNPHAARAAEGGFLATSAFVAFVQRRARRLSTRFRAAGPEPEQSADNVVRDYRAELPAAVDAAFREQWAELEALQREVGVPMYVVIAPYALQVNEEPGLTGLQDYVAALCVASNLRCLDPLELFVANAESELFTPGSSYHFSTIGHALLSDWLVPRLTATPEQP